MDLRDFRIFLTKIDQHRRFYASCGPQDLSRSLDRIENIQFATWIARNRHTNAPKHTPEKRVKTPNQNPAQKQQQMTVLPHFPRYCINLKR